ncbi:MAG: amidohydrolase [Fluviicola sp.]
MKHILYISALLLLNSCMKGKSVDLVVHNAKIYSMDANFKEYEAVAIKDGKIVELGAERQILNRYSAEEYVDAEGKEIYPALTDAHGHIFSYARMKLSVNVFGVKNMQELIVKADKYNQRNNYGFVLGWGWDQTLFPEAKMPTNEELNKKFPSTPVAIWRVDGHAMLLNQKALEVCGIDENTTVKGGQVLVENGKCTGVVLDGAVNKVLEKWQDFPRKKLIESILEVQDELLQYGVLSVHEAGLTHKDLNLLLKLNDQNKLQVQVYGMLYPEPKNIVWAKKNGHFKKKNVSIRSFKLMVDGALGSHGAFLKKNYSDENYHNGILVLDRTEMRKVLDVAEAIDYQVNFHAIGDSTNRLVLEEIQKMVKIKPDHRWRVEHAQVLDPKDFALFTESGAIPSVQPVHLATDHIWAEKRLGKERLIGAYAYASLLKATGILLIGTDFPVERINPMANLIAATQRTNTEGLPAGGFMMSEQLTKNEFMLGMTLSAAIGSFSEEKKGSLEKGKDADFVIFDSPFDFDGGQKEVFAKSVYAKGKVIYLYE